jgi:hypothetical protein
MGTPQRRHCHYGAHRSDNGNRFGFGLGIEIGLDDLDLDDLPRPSEQFAGAIRTKVDRRLTHPGSLGNDGRGQKDQLFLVVRIADAVELRDQLVVDPHERCGQDGINHLGIPRPALEALEGETWLAGRKCSYGDTELVFRAGELQLHVGVCLDQLAVQHHCGILLIGHFLGLPTHYTCLTHLLIPLGSPTR